LFLDSSTCFERYFRSSSGASQLYLQLLVLFTYPWLQPAATYVNNTRSCKYSCDAPDDERKYRSKHVELSRNNKLSYTVASCWSFSYVHHDTCATSRKIAGSIPDGVNGIFHWHNPSGRTMALRLPQPLTEMSTRNDSWG